MSKILTLSRFYFGTLVTRENRALDFSEGGPELQANLNLGDYTLDQFAAEIQRALRVAGTLEYLVTVERESRIITIEANGDFELLANSGTRVPQSIWLLAGFPTSGDYTGGDTYMGANGAGFEYLTQYPVGEYISELDNPTRESATYTVTPTGVGQMISFADSARIQMDIRLVTNKQLRNKPFYYNPNGINDLRLFMSYLLDKNKVEFMPDASDFATYSRVYLEATQEDKGGFEYELKHMETPEIKHTGRLTFRKVLE